MSDDKSPLQGLATHEVLFSLYGLRSAFQSDNFATKELFHSSEAVLLKKILSIGQECCNLKKYINSIENNQLEEENVDLYLLEFVECLDQVLEPYLSDVIELENDISESSQNTLQYIWSKIEMYSDLLYGLNSLVKEITQQNSKGCLLLQHLQDRLCGDAGAMRTAVKHIVLGVNKIFIRHIKNWLLFGELTDSHKHFFISRCQITVGNEDCVPFKEYILNVNMLPNHIGLSLAKKILDVGQTVLFLRSNPYSDRNGDVKGQVYVNENGIFGEKGRAILEKVRDIESMEMWNENGVVEKLVSEVSSCVATQLWTLAMEKARLVEELRSVKEFFLLGRGELFHDFVTHLDQSLSKAANKHLDLNVLLGESARRVLLKEENLQRFTVERLRSAGGWARINLRYDMPWPLQLLFTPSVLASYNSVFRFLLRLKRIQVKMVSSWLSHKSKKYEESGPKGSQLHRNLWFLINNLQYYLQVDVLDSQYMILEAAVENSTTFDEIEKAHSIFLSNLISQTFILDQEIETKMENPIYHSVDKILQLCEEYSRHMDFNGDEDMDSQMVENLSIKFEACVEYLLRLLAVLSKQATHPCSRYLSQFLLRLDFNNYFSSQFSANLSIIVN